MLPNPRFVKFDTFLFSVEKKVTNNFQKLQKGNNCPIGENSPDLVTLLRTDRFTEVSIFLF
jgi:hypothetical protein